MIRIGTCADRRTPVTISPDLGRRAQYLRRTRAVLALFGECGGSSRMALGPNGVRDPAFPGPLRARMTTSWTQGHWQRLWRVPHGLERTHRGS